MIEVEHFSYCYGNNTAVDDISFKIDDGEIVALIGPNGAGKSTTMKVLTTLMQPSAGTIKVAGYDIVENPIKVRQNLGYLPENNPLYSDMLVYDALMSVAQQRQIQKNQRYDAVKNVAAQCGLNEVMHKPIDTLSKGYRQRVGIAQAIIHQPPVLILDEATTGLDPNQIREIRDLILQIGQHKTVLISTHILQEVTAIANRVIIMNHGKIVCNDKISDLLNTPELIQKYPNPGIEDLFAFHTHSKS